jgi:hypothetical protein
MPRCTLTVSQCLMATCSWGRAAASRSHRCEEQRRRAVGKMAVVFRFSLGLACHSTACFDGCMCRLYKPAR